jgi:hypothetical protein
MQVEQAPYAGDMKARAIDASSAKTDKTNPTAKAE